MKYLRKNYIIAKMPIRLNGRTALTAKETILSQFVSALTSFQLMTISHLRKDDKREKTAGIEDIVKIG
jgi:hypothetical protein